MGEVMDLWPQMDTDEHRYFGFVRTRRGDDGFGMLRCRVQLGIASCEIGWLLMRIL